MKVSIEPTSALVMADIVRRSPQASIPGVISLVTEWYRASIACFTGYADGVPACMWGIVAPSILSGNPAYLWLVTTDLVEDHKFTFVRHSQMAVAEVLKSYPFITGHCVAEQTQSIRWLRWLGAKFGPPADGLVPFELRAAHG